MELYYLIIVSVMVVVVLDIFLIRWLRKRNPYTKIEQKVDNNLGSTDQPQRSNNLG